MSIISLQCQRYFPVLLVFAFMLMVPLAHAAGTIDEERTNEYASAFWNSFNKDLSSGALEVYLKHWDDNAERITPTVHAKGIKAIRAVYENYLATYSDFHQQEIRRIVDGNVVVSELVTTARNKASGEILSLPNVAIVEFNDGGKVSRARVYLDTRKFNP